MTRALGSKVQVEEFVSRKHGPLYRRAWLPYLSRPQSVKLAFGHLIDMLAFRVKKKLSMKNVLQRHSAMVREVLNS